MLMKNQREEIVEYGRRMLTSGLTRNTGGYLSIYDRAAQTVAVKPSSMDYMKIRTEDVIVVDLNGNKLEGNGRLSTEWPVQQAIYANRDDIDALVHTHSPFATTISALRLELPAANFTVSRAGGNVRCTEFFNFTSQQLADSILEKMQDRYAVLLGNHGLVAGERSLAAAYDLAEDLEFCCEVFWRAKCVGEPVVLSEEQMQEQIQELSKYYGHTNK